VVCGRWCGGLGATSCPNHHSYVNVCHPILRACPDERDYQVARTHHQFISTKWLQPHTIHVNKMASDLPEVPDAPNVFLEALQDEEIADMLQYEADRRRVKGSRPAMHEEPLRVRSIAASTGLAADTEESASVAGN